MGNGATEKLWTVEFWVSDITRGVHDMLRHSRRPPRKLFSIRRHDAELDVEFVPKGLFKGNHLYGAVSSTSRLVRDAVEKDAASSTPPDVGLLSMAAETCYGNLALLRMHATERVLLGIASAEAWVFNSYSKQICEELVQVTIDMTDQEIIGTMI